MRAKRERLKQQRTNAWLAPVTIDERAKAYSGAMPSQNGCRASDKGFLAMSLESYLMLLDWTGRQMRSGGKCGRVPAEVAPILKRVGISSGVWCDVVKRFGKIFQRVAGGPQSLAREAQQRRQGWLQTLGSPLPSTA